MQLSLPLPVYTAPAASNPAPCNAPSSADHAAKKSTDSPSDSFESYLSKDRPIDDPAEKDKGPDADKAAEMVAALFGMPVVPPTLPPPLGANLPTATVQVTPGEITVADPSVCFASPSSRSFGPGLPVTGPLGAMRPLGSTTIPPALPAAGADKTAGLSSPAPLSGTPPVADLVTATPSAPILPVATEEKGGLGSLDNSAALKALAGSPGFPATLPPAASPLDPANTASAITLANVPPVSGTVMPVQPLKRLAVVSTASSETSINRTTSVSESPVTDGAELLTSGLVADGSRSADNNLNLAKNHSASENFAALPSTPDGNSKTSIMAQGKYFLDAGRKLVAAVGESVGTGVAKVNATMSAAATIHLKIPATSDPAAPFVFSGEVSSTGTLTVEAPTPVTTVRETMAAIISAVDALERRADVQQKSVDLHFNVGSEKLGLRVELRDGAVHTTFRTESAEMNTVIAREWHSITQPVGERGMRLAEPVFTSTVTASGGSDFGSLGQGTPHQREQKAPPSFASVLKPEFYDSGVPESVAKDSPAVSSSQLLNALA